MATCWMDTDKKENYLCTSLRGQLWWAAKSNTIDSMRGNEEITGLLRGLLDILVLQRRKRGEFTSAFHKTMGIWDESPMKGSEKDIHTNECLCHGEWTMQCIFESLLWCYASTNLRFAHYCPQEAMFSVLKISLFASGKVSPVLLPSLLFSHSCLQKYSLTA